MRLTRAQVQRLVTEHPGRTIDQLADLLEVPRKRVENHLYRLAVDRLVHSRGWPHSKAAPRKWHPGPPKRVASVFDLA